MTDTSPKSSASGETPYDGLAEAKQLLRTIRSGALATLAPPEGKPFVSLVNVATMPDGRPVLLMSRLSAHTRHLEADPRLSLLLASSGEGDPLAHPRLTLVGTAERANDSATRLALRARFLAKHPKSALYADFTDFSFWLVSFETAHLNGGFGRAGNYKGAALLTPVDEASEVVAGEEQALAHMNADHTDALALYARSYAGKADGPWVATGLDPEGLDLALDDQTARILFHKPVNTLASVRSALIRLGEDARAKLASGQ
jgi:putative heme iron utilization protein